MIVFGVDAGTSLTKAVAFDADGRALRVESRPTRLVSPGPGLFEQDADEVVASVGDVLRALVTAVGLPDAVGITGQGDGLWLVDGGGRPVRPAVSWMDGRASELLREWIMDGTCAEVYRRTGSAMFPGSPGPLLAHLDRSEPAPLDRAVTAGYCKDVVMQRLTGVRATDASDASSPFLDIRARRYDDTALATCGLAHRRHLLAPVAPGPGPTGPLTPDGARVTGVAEGTPVTAGPFDIVASARGAGMAGLGDGLLIIGTTLACEVLTDAVDTGGEPAGLTLCGWRPDRWVRAMPAMVGTASLDWVTELTGVDRSGLGALLDASPPGAGGVAVLPYFSPAGERAPFLDPDARAQFDGVTLHTTRADLIRAVCEGVAYAARHCFEAAGLTGRAMVCGGGAGCEQWLRIFASVLQRPLYLARGPEVGARGAALTALASAGRAVDEPSWTRPERCVDPDPDLVGRYDEGYAGYLRRLERARAAWAERSP